MIHTDSRFAASVEAAVTRLEQGTDAELVVVAAPRSGSYRDVAYAFGAALAALLMLVAVFSPVHWDPHWLPAEAVALFLIGSWAAEKQPWLLRLLTSAGRRRRQAREAAAAAFHQDQVHATRGRTGLLIYLSALEQHVEVIPDHGLDARIPHGNWHRVCWNASTLEGFLASLDAAGGVLAEHVPALDGDNPDELPNAPRIRP